jgi:hypothetical protein
MKLSELIKQLQEIEKESGGDIECYASRLISTDEYQTLEIIACDLRIDNHRKHVELW